MVTKESNAKLLIRRGMIETLTKVSFIIVCTFWFTMSNGTPLVYNMKIRRVFSGINAFLKRTHRKPLFAVSVVPITYRRTAHIVTERTATNLFEKRSGGGALINARFIPDRSWWLEITSALQKETVQARGTAEICASRGGLDDIVLAGGYNWFPRDELQFGVYGLAGFPTRRKVTLQEVEGALVGSRFFGVGAGAELSYGFISEKKRSFIGILQGRYIHFFERCWQPILPPGGKIVPGDTSDILLGIRYRYGRTSFETGYNATIFTGQAIKVNGEKISTRTSVRHGVYGNIMHLSKRFTFAGKPLAVGAGFNFNRLPKLDANTILVWFNFTVII